MEIKNFGLMLYIAATLLAIIAAALDYETLRLFTNPIIIPAISFFYMYEKQEQYSHLYGLALFLCFIGDILIFLDLDVVLYIMIPYFFSYLILFAFIIEDIRQIKLKKEALLLAITIFICLLFLLYTLVSFLILTSPKLVIPSIVYGFFLSIYGSLGIFYFLNEKSIVSKYLLFFIVLSIFSDVFYVVFKLITSYQNLVFVEFSAQLFSYYFMVKYFSLRKIDIQNFQK